MDDVVAVYLTFPDEASAERVARALVERRLAACVNVVPGARSFYRWEGAVQAEPEVLAVAKTRATRLPALTAAAQALHPYEVPCVVAYPALGGLEGYLDWVRSEASDPEPGDSDREAATEPPEP